MLPKPNKQESKVSTSVSKSMDHVTHNLRLYYVRIHDPKEKLDVQTVFSDEIKIHFEAKEQLEYDTNCSPFIYTFNFALKMDGSKNLLVHDDNSWKKIRRYHLEISRSKSILSTVTYEEEGSASHQLIDYLDDEHNFLFDIHFTSKHNTHLPGLDPSIFISLCLFSYFLLREKHYNTFNILANQFTSLLSTKQYSLKEEEFIEFFERCHRYFRDILPTSDKHLTIVKIILCMVGFLPIDKTNFARKNRFSHSFANQTLSYVRSDFDKIYQSVDETEYTLFKRGLTTLLSIELLQNEDDDYKNDKFYFLKQVSDEERRQDLSYDLLLKLFQLEHKIIGHSYWTDLFLMVPPKIIVINHLELTNSFQTFFAGISKISRVLCDDNVFKDQINAYFEDRVSKDHLEVNLKSISYLMKAVEVDPPDEPLLTKQYVTIVQSAIKYSAVLKSKIKEFFDKFKLNRENMEKMKIIIDSIDKYTMLDYIDKFQYLKKSLQDLSTGFEYMQWFLCFLAKGQVDNSAKRQKYEELLEYWIECVENINYKDLLHILKNLDMLLDGFDQSDDCNQFRLQCINRIIDLCFKQRICTIIRESLLDDVQNELFCEEFKKRFYKEYVDSKQQSTFKDISNNDNLLSEFIDLDKIANGKSLLVRSLIELICDQIETIDKADVLRETFLYPTQSSLTSVVLFENVFETLPVRKTIIQQLTLMWNEWETDGFQLERINNWTELNQAQKKIACQIWNFIGKMNGKTTRFEQWIGEEERKIQEIFQIKESITMCLNNHCTDAHDKNLYLSYLDALQRKVNQGTVSSAQIQRGIELLKPFSKDLNQIYPSHAWQYYLKQNTESKKLDKTVNNDTQERTCLNILKEIAEIRSQFISLLECLCIDTNKALHPQLEQLFSEKDFIDYELTILKPLLTGNIAVQLELLLSYWKNRDRIFNICKGCNHMMEEYNFPTSDKLLLLQNIVNFDNKTSSETCIAAYQDYCTHFSNKYSETTLKLIAQWSISHALLKYVYSLKTTDVDDLLEVVNDWDESLINTKTVLDFVLLKRFLDKINAEIETIKMQRSVELDDIIISSEKILKQNEFQNLLLNFAACLKNLPSIQRISTGATNKEQSKRKHILDIMTQSDFCFCAHQGKELINTNNYQFDIHIRNNNWEPVSFNDLSDLRDRARLIQHASSNSNNVQNYTEVDIQKLQSFVSLVDTIETIIQMLTALYTAGYPVMTEYPISKRKFTCYETNYSDIENFRKTLATQLIDWEKRLCTMYKECLNLTYLSYQQISMIEDALHKQTAIMTNNPIYHLLKFVGIDPKSIQLNILSDKSKTPFELLKTVANIVQTKQDSSYSLTQKEHVQVQEKICVVETTNKDILRVILSLFDLNGVSTPPNANQLFYCTKYTSWVEIRAFIYRCFYSQTLHQLIQPELLSIVIHDQFAQLLNQLMEQSPNQLFHLRIITTQSSTQLPLLSSFRTNASLQILSDQDLLNENILGKRIQELIGDRCMLVTSKISGLGKSTYIQKEICRLGKTQIKFPISGDMDIDTLMGRLRDQKIQSVPSTVALHINIGPIENVEQLNAFLYCLILFRCFRFGQMPVDVSKDIPIYIEFDSSLHLFSLQNEIIIFRYLNTKYFERLEWNELDVTSTDIQWVANYLQAVEDNTINEKDIREETITTLDQSVCIGLLEKYFLSKKNLEFISWTQLSIFLSVYYNLFSGYSNCGYFIVDPKVKSSLRSDILKSLLNSSNQFTSLSVETVRNNQRAINGNEDILPLNETVIRWDKLQPFTLLFTTTDEPLFVYRIRGDIPSSLENAFRLNYKHISSDTTQVATTKSKQGFFSWFRKSSSTETSPSEKTVEQYLDEFLIDPNQMTHEQFFLRLTSLSNKYFIRKSVCGICFNQFDYDEKRCTSCLTEDSLIRPASLKDQDITDFQKRMAEKLHSQYVLTADNYIKMLLIYLRVQSNLPVLIMGETGCGKTALIQCLCRKILDDDMEVFHIHAGVTNEKIIETMHDYTKQAQKFLEEKPNKRLWIFFDEFNTTLNIGLLKEIICERTLLGESLPNNMAFLGACNPQRRKIKKEEPIEQFGISKYHSDMQRQIHGTQSSLLYSVVPIPETMLEHVWDYGFLDEITERKYIEKILHVCKDITTDNNWFICTVTLISESQKYFRAKDDVSSVSLRDAARFCRFYNWFYKFQILSDNQQTSVTCPFTPIERASLLALFLCYYFRLDSSVKRKNYMTIIADFVQKPNISLESLNEFLHNEKMALVERMEVPQGTAKNGALADNIFVLFTCILNRIPVILCGQPGSSKTSAVQIIISNLKGARSEDPIFSQQSELVAVSYQGSHNCTAESIIKVFERADKYADAKSEIQLLPVIVFDEIGLAEVSAHNPLKVLHSQLEMEACRHGFVGLSNWRLDASKMNRAVYLSCPEPDIEDLKLTAESLSTSMLPSGSQIVPLDSRIVEGVAVAYMKICENMKKQTNKHYFGLRDYYSLIKGIMHDTLQENYKDEHLYKIIRSQFACNFDDLNDGSKLIWTAFCESMHEDHKVSQYPSPTFDQLLNQCLLSRNGRFLMLIGDSESSFDYVQRYITIQHPTIQTRTLIGSTFSGDFLSNTTYTEQYNIRVLMDIILDAERNSTLFLRGLGHLYDNLYDLFNQSFAVSAKKKYCRIALGSLYHPRCVIHDEFYCVVFVKKQDLFKYDLPFLNRFEKHQINRDSLLNERHKNVASKLDQWINQIISMKTSTNFPLKKHLFPEFSDNYTLNLVADALDHFQRSNSSVDDQDVLTYCQHQLLRMSSFDLPLLLSLEDKTNREQLIEQYYETHKDLKFASFINEEFEQKKNTKLLIYTYTQIYHTIDYSDITNHEEWIEEIKLSYFKTELELIQKLKVHNKSSSIRLLCIRVDYHRDHQHIPILKHILINEQVNDVSRGVCLIFHLQRCELSQTNNDVFFDGWCRVMIDDLQTHQLIPETILMNPSYGDLITHLNFLNMETTFDELINRCIIQFHYVVSNKNQEIDINKRRNRIIEHLTLRSTKTDNADKPLRSLVKNCLLQLIQNIVPNQNQTQFNDWRQDLLSNGITIGSSRSFNDALIKTISLYLDEYLSLLFLYLEKHSLIDSYLFLIDSNEQTRAKLQPLWNDFWTTTIQKIDPSIINQNYIETSLMYNLHLPCATGEYEIICQIRQIVAQSRQNDDKHLIDLAYNQLISKSYYGSFIDKIFQDSDIFTHYYHDQLILTENEANVHHLPTSLIQCLTSKISDDVKYQLTYLLVYHEELFEIMRLFEIGLTMIDEKCLMEIINQQYIVCDNSNENTVKNSTSFYSLVQGEENIYLIPPQSPIEDQYIYEGEADAFMEISLMNLIELLISQPVIDSVNDIDNLILVYSLFSQFMNKLSRYGQHIVVNFEKFISFLRLASCISTLFPSGSAMIILKEVCRYSNGCSALSTLDDIHKFIIYLRNVIEKKGSTVGSTIINQTLLKFENELLRNWSFDNSDKCSDILNFINNNDLWKYSAKIFTFINKNLNISETIEKTSGQISQDDENEEVEQNDEDNQDLTFPDDPTRKIEIIMSTQLYTQLVLNENYQSQIIDETNDQILSVLKQNFDSFQQNISEVNKKQNDHTLQLVALTAWLKYYLLYYAYALKNDIKGDIMGEIDKILVEYHFDLCSTVKLYIIKLLCSSESITLTQLCEKYTNRTTVWIRQMINRSTYARPANARRHIVLPTPLFEFLDDFKRIDDVFSEPMIVAEIRALVRQCSESQSKTYCFIMWFVHYYSRFYMSNVLPNDPFVRLIGIEMAKELGEWLEPIGHKLIYSLCNNFDRKSYFQLNSSMTEQDCHQRLLVLNIIALLISFRSIKQPSFLNSILFNENFKKPDNYIEHFKQLSEITGVALANDPALIQMMYMRNQIEKQPDLNIKIFQCSSQCPWIFYIVNSTISDEHKHCPLCKKNTNISLSGELLITNTSHISMTKNETMNIINTYIEEHKLKDLLHEVEKPDHLSQPLTYHFMDFLIQAVFLYLYELDHMPCSTSTMRSYFRESVQTKFTLLHKTLSNADQSYIWLYKLINHMVGVSLPFGIGLKSTEKFIEKILIIPHTDSIIDEMRKYKSAYVNFVYAQDKNNELIAFVDELIEDNNKYPLLNFFNITNIHSIDIIDHFYSQLQLQPNYDDTYPVTNFILKNLSNYDNIQYLHPLVRFINYLMQQFDHRIKRTDANKKTIADCLKNDSNLKSIFVEFLDAWCKINLEEVSFDQKKYKLQPAQSKYNFENKTYIPMFLLNKSNDNENMIPAACLQTIGKFQNKILDYFHSNVLKHTKEHDYRVIPIQSIHQKHLFNFGTNKIRELLVEKGLVINYSYGMSQEIIYDYGEIEWTLRNEISCLPKIDVKNIRYFNYQGELYDENMSLINEIRSRFKQKLLEDQKRVEMKKFINFLDNNSILGLSNSLAYILTYLRTINNKKIVETSTIQTFIDLYIQSKTYLNNALSQQPFSSLSLEYIIDLHELIEEHVFDSILRMNIRTELCEKSFSKEQKTSISIQFINMIISDEKLANCFKDFNCWIDMFKRLLVRLLLTKMNINFDSSLHPYVRRNDMWKSNITSNDLQTIEIKDNILLKHAFIILKGLEAKLNEKTSMENQQGLVNNEIEPRSSRNSIQSTTSLVKTNSILQKKKAPPKRTDLR